MCSPSYSHPALMRYVSTELGKFLRFSYFEKIGGTNGRTDMVQHLMRLVREGCIKIHYRLACQFALTLLASSDVVCPDD